ncbi:MAG: SUMF1/EgtB/PvdO family nonheme iron enzyme [Tepidisphaeraceae bacterium]|jgi:formylglycine-generating enzyme required for sulfatase activity
MNRKSLLLLAPVTFTAALLAGERVASSAITIQTVPVGNVGNAADTDGYGSVNYAYDIGEYDVTASQYAAFLNAVAQTDPFGVYNSLGVYPSVMTGTTDGNPGIVQNGSAGSYTYSVAAGRGNYPVTDVSFWDACRFANWLDNGQPTGPEGVGTTETGSYSLTSNDIYNNTVTRNAGATWAVASEDEWHKAAYYSPNLNEGSGGYWQYPTQSNTISTTQANYNDVVGDTTAVGSYPYPSYYGTYDQGGDAFQWNETIIDDGLNRGLQGGNWYSNANVLQSDDYTVDDGGPSAIDSGIGFRVVEVPEPVSVGILVLVLSGMLFRRPGSGRNRLPGLSSLVRGRVGAC